MFLGSPYSIYQFLVFNSLDVGWGRCGSISCFIPGSLSQYTYCHELTAGWHLSGFMTSYHPLVQGGFVCTSRTRCDSALISHGLVIKPHRAIGAGTADDRDEKRSGAWEGLDLSVNIFCPCQEVPQFSGLCKIRSIWMQPGNAGICPSSPHEDSLLDLEMDILAARHVELAVRS